MSIVVHLHAVSPCSGAVLLTIRALGIDDLVTKKVVDLSKGEHLEPDYVQKFPLHTVPSLEEDGFFLWDSHAIVAYLASAYQLRAPEAGTLYPADPKKRAKVDQWLHFSNSILNNRLRDMSEPLLTKQSKVVSEEHSERAEGAFKMMEDQLGPAPGPWLCGPDMTLADLCCVSNVTAIEIFIGDSRHYPKLSTWLDHCKSHVPGYADVIEANRAQYAKILSTMMTS